MEQNHILYLDLGMKNAVRTVHSKLCKIQLCINAK